MCDVVGEGRVITTKHLCLPRRSQDLSMTLPLNKARSISSYFHRALRASPPPLKRVPQSHVYSTMSSVDPASLPSVADTHQAGTSKDYKPDAKLNARIAIWRGELAPAFPRPSYPAPADTRRHHQAQGTRLQDAADGRRT